MDQVFVEKMKHRLFQEKDSLQAQLKNITNEGEDGRFKGDSEAKKPEYGDSEDENTDEVVAFQENISTASDLEEHLEKVERALLRLEAGKYGICNKCGQEIPQERLEAFPAAENCVACKK